MPRDNAKRRREYARRRQLFEQLRLQADVLCDLHEEGKQTIVLSRMMNIILDVIGDRGLNDAKREALADHFTDCAYEPHVPPEVELGGTGNKDALSLMGQFSIPDLAKRIVWTDTRSNRVIEGEKVA